MLADEPPLTGDPHPEVWDLICVGTGLAETMLARCVPRSPSPHSAPDRTHARDLAHVVPGSPRLLPPFPRRSAAARAGKSVLHLDPADAYGGAFGALAESSGGVGWDVPSSADLERRAAMCDGLASDSGADEDAEEDAVAFPALGAPVDARARLGATSYCSPATPSGSGRRHFSLDRSGPRVALGADAFVDVLVRSGAHKYVEFKAVDATAIFRSRDAGFSAVPASRAEVFRDKTLGLAEKRALMRVLKLVVRVAERDGKIVGAGDPDAADAAVGAPGSEWRAAGDAAAEAAKPPPARSSADVVAPLYEREDELFSVALERLGLARTSSASSAVQFALALSGDESEPARNGFESLTAYLASLHRFGPGVGAALAPVYGAGEFPQAFARLAAVHGATCALRVGARRALFARASASEGAASRGAVVVTAGGQKLRCRALAAAADATRATRASERAPARWISRMTAVVDGACAFFPDESRASDGTRASERGEDEEGCAPRTGETTLLAVFPPGSVRGAPAGAATRVAQLSAATGACPRGFGPRELGSSPHSHGGWRVLHASVASRDPARSAEDDLRGVLELLADTSSLRGYEAETAESPPTEKRGERGDAPFRSKPRAAWVCFHREVAPEDARAVVASWSALPRNFVTCPGPDARAEFADLVAVAEAAAARLWGGEAPDAPGVPGAFLFPAARATGGDDGAAAAADGRGTRTEDSDEDEMDALLRDLPGGIGA